MFDLVFANPIFWVNIIVTIIVAACMFIFSKKYVWWEGALQFAITAIILLIVYLIGFETSFELRDKEVLNGKIEKFVYYEEWTERVMHTRTTKVGKTSVTTVYYTNDYRPAYWQIETTVGVCSSSKDDFLKAKKMYGTTFKDIFRLNKVSIGDGNKYESIPRDTIPVSAWHSYVNYIRASRFTILKKKGNQDLIKEYEASTKLVKYPIFIKEEFGQDYFFRIINTSLIKINLRDFEKKLSLFCAENSKTKQFNLLIYITSGVQRNFKDVLEEYWKSGHKNDTILIFNLNEDGSIAWSDSISWTQNATYTTDIKYWEGNFNSKDFLNDLYNKITENILKNWERIPMKTFEYLKSELELPVWFQIVVLIINVISNILLWFAFSRNSYTKDSY